MSGDSFTSVEAKNIRKMVKSRGSFRSVVDGNMDTPMDKAGTMSKIFSQNSNDDFASSSSGGSPSASNDRNKAAGEEEKILASLPSDLQDIFSSIGEYKPRKVNIKTELKCFIPPYIPTVGSVDHMIKIPRPDGIKDNIGISVIDEPSMRQSDAAVLELQLRDQMKKRTRGSIVRSIDRAANNPKEIDVWIESTEEIYRSRQAPEVVYIHPMPDMEELIMRSSSSSQTLSSLLPEEIRNALDQEKGEFREALNPDLSLSLATYAKILCFLLDIPVREGSNNLVQSLHFLFTLYYEFQQGRIITASDIHTDAVSVL